MRNLIRRFSEWRAKRKHTPARDIDCMQHLEYLDKDGWRYVWVDGVLDRRGVPAERLRALGGSEPYAVSRHKRRTASTRWN